jgi:catalase
MFWNDDHRCGDDYRSQSGAFIGLLDDAQKARLFGNIARHMNGVAEEIHPRGSRVSATPSRLMLLA